MENFIKKDKRIISISFLIGIVISVVLGAAFSKVYADRTQKKIAENVIRFHVIANSDSETDQALKLKVRDSVIACLNDKLEGCTDRDESRRIIEENLDDIEAAAKDTVEAEGYIYDVKAEICTDTFPLRQYGEVRLPSGDYEALKVSIGAAEGHNWWCVVYPPLCFVDAAQGDVSEKSQERLIKAVDSDITVVSDDIVPEFKFKVVELWQNFEHRNDSYAVKP